MMEESIDRRKLLTLFWRDIKSTTSLMLPELIPLEKPCAVCLKCIDECPGGTLQVKRDLDRSSGGKANINRSKCLAWNGQLCNSCKNACQTEESAIIFNKMRYPVTSKDKCIGCGRCVTACIAPVPAIEIIPP